MNVLLTILIVSNNRRILLEEQVENLLELLSRHPAVKFELIVSETSSLDLASSSKLDSKDTPPHVDYKYIFRSHSFVTAEEHLLARLEMPVGDYCWILGDDDPVVPDGLNDLVRALTTSLADFILFDSYSLSSDGQVFGSSCRNYFPLGDSYLSMNELIAIYGFWFVPSGFSITIFRREMFDIQVFREHILMSAIYSHVSAFIECFSASRCVTVGTALVWYRMNLSDEGGDDNWQRLSRTKGHSQNYPWTLGFCSLLNRLIFGGFIHLNTIRLAMDQNHAARFVWHMLAMEMVIFQCRFDIKNLDELSQPSGLYGDSRSISGIDWNEFIRFWELVLRPFPVCSEFVELLSIYYNIVLTASALGKLPSHLEGVPLRARLNRLCHAFEALACSIYDRYLGVYMYNPMLFWIEQGAAFGLQLEPRKPGIDPEDEAEPSRNMRLLTHAFRGCMPV